MKINFYMILVIILISFIQLSCSDATTINQDFCKPNPCQNSKIPHKTVCKQIKNDFSCVCELGYKLKDDICIKINNNIPCENNPCTETNKSICLVVGDSYECNCDVKYHLDGDKCIRDMGTVCEDYMCKDKFSSCKIDINGEPFCDCINGYIDNNGKCEFDCSTVSGSIVNDENNKCICKDGTHLENNKCLSNTRRVSCKTDNPNKPSNAQEVISSLDINWNETTNEWAEIPYCSWICDAQYQGDNCDECATNYIMNSETNTCLYDCSNDENSKPNDENNACICINGFHIGSNGFCIRTVNPCENNPCLVNTGSLKTKCIANSQELADYTCECEDGFEENSDGICFQLSEIHIRAVTGNISTGNNQSYDQGEGIRIFQALKGDIMMVQEFNYKEDSEDDYKEFVKKVFQDPACFQENTCFYEVGSGAVIPNGIVSRFPILSHGEWRDPAGGVDNTRHLNYAIIDIPGNKDLFVVSVHLRTKTGSDQVEEAEVVTDAIQEMKEESDYLGYYFMVGGDFNGATAACDPPRDTDGFAKNGIFNVCDTFPVGEDGYTATNASRATRAKHLDWLLVSSDLSPFQVSTDFCSESNENDCKRYPNGLVMDTRSFTQSELDTYFSPTSFDNRALSVGDSDGNSMQHMAIIKDFVINFGE